MAQEAPTAAVAPRRPAAATRCSQALGSTGQARALCKEVEAQQASLLRLWDADLWTAVAVVPYECCVALRNINCISSPVFLLEYSLALCVTVIWYVGA